MQSLSFFKKNKVGLQMIRIDCDMIQYNNFFFLSSIVKVKFDIHYLSQVMHF